MELKKINPEMPLNYIIKATENGIKEYPYEKDKPELFNIMVEDLRRRLENFGSQYAYFTVIGTPYEKDKNGEKKELGRLYF